jgi:hypothetical protein
MLCALNPPTPCALSPLSKGGEGWGEGGFTLLQQPLIVPLRHLTIGQLELARQHSKRLIPKRRIRQPLRQIVVDLHIRREVPQHSIRAERLRALPVRPQPVRHLVIPYLRQLRHQPMAVASARLVQLRYPARAEIDAPVAVDSGGVWQRVGKLQRGGIERGRKPADTLRRIHPRRSHPLLDGQSVLLLHRSTSLI